MNEAVTINQLKLFIENLRRAKASLHTTSVQVALVQEEKTTPSLEQSGESFQPKAQQEIDVATATRSTTQEPERELSKKPEQTLLLQSKEQTEAITDKTKIETFTKYLQKYEQRLMNRTMTLEEKAVIESLVELAQSILVQHTEA